MYTVYVLRSLKTGRYYIGQTKNLEQRIIRHNKGWEKFTNKEIPWDLVYKTDFGTRSEAVKREKLLKSYKNGNAFNKLVMV